MALAEVEKTKGEAELEAPKAPEPPKELEDDAKKDSSPRIKDKVTFLTPDTTMNVAPSTTGNILVSLSEGGLGQLFACARANVGIKSGRYMFEARILQQKSSRTCFRIGFSTEGSLFLGEEENSICFDVDGKLVHKGVGKNCAGAFEQDSTVAVVLNLDSSSPNFNTVSLFKNGARASEPQVLPDALKGQVLFPAVAFKNSIVHVNFGAPSSPLPFTCKSIDEASVADSFLSKYDAPADGKCTAYFPVCLPDEGTFDWLDGFLEKNPDYTELSDRALAEWGSKSGLKPHGKQSNDKPDTGFDATMARKTLLDVLAMQPRNIVFMEVKGNLVKEDRVAAMAKFQAAGFKTVADVLVGEAPSSFKKIVLAKTLQAKQAALDAEAKTKFIEEKRQWAARKNQKEKEHQKKLAEKEKLKRQKQVAEARKKVEKENKKRAKEAAAKKAAEEGTPIDKDDEEIEEEEEKKEDEDEHENMELEVEPEPVQSDPPKAELTAEEKAYRFFKHPLPDLTPYVLSTSLANFTLPETSEGFTTVKYSWSKEKQAADYVKNWLLAKKLTTRVENLSPSQWFKEHNSKWTKDLSDLKNALNDYKAGLSKRAADKMAREQRKKVAEKKAQIEAEQKAKAQSEKATEETEKKDDDSTKEEEKGEQKPAASMEVDDVEEAQHPSEAVDFEGIDIFGVEDVCDIGGGMPLSKEFQFEDFALMSLRAELHMLIHAFVKDVNDADRKGVHIEHLAFYYKKYFGKDLSLGSFGVKSSAELVGLVNDTIIVSESSKVLSSVVPANLESYAVFVKLTERARRHRGLMLDMGDDSAKLKIVKSRDERDRHGEKRAWGPAFGKGGGKSKKGRW